MRDREEREGERDVRGRERERVREREIYRERERESVRMYPPPCLGHEVECSKAHAALRPWG